MGYVETGVLNRQDIRMPSDERFAKGPVAIIECVQEIPCDPCVDSCPKGAIRMEGSINDIPVVDFELCNGCGVCVSNCPGLAIFIVDQGHSDERASVGMPYEFRPLPEVGETVALMDRAGEVCGEGEVIKIRNTKAQDRTPLVYLTVDKGLSMDIRFFRRKKDEG